MCVICACIEKEIRAGTTIPPNAAPNGSTAFLKEASSPATSSLYFHSCEQKEKRHQKIIYPSADARGIL
jgi:hypothetical protein